MDTRTDDANCGACGVACAALQICVGSACAVALRGSGTASDPYTATPRPRSCLAYRDDYPTVVRDGAYLISLSGVDTLVYCDMAAGAGTTYEAMGFGIHSTSYTGWQWIGSADLAASGALRDAFVFHYNRLGGLRNLAVGFNSGNCCIINPPGAPARWYGFAGSQHMYPARPDNSLNCAGPYNTPLIRLFLVPAGSSRASFTSDEVANVVHSSGCGVSSNPAIFVRRFR